MRVARDVLLPSGVDGSPRVSTGVDSARRESTEGSARISLESLEGLAAEGAEVQVLISDGLGAEAVHHDLAW
jgi:hypothetical protein